MTKQQIVSGSGITLRHAGAGLLIGLVLMVCGIYAQNTVTGAFQGSVSNNQTNAPVGGAAVEIVNEQTAAVYNLVTDSKGRFYQGLLPPGSYQIRITIAGFRTVIVKQEIRVSKSGEVIPVPVSLEPDPTGSTAAQQVTTADNIRVEINRVDARRDASTKDEEIVKLPLGATAVTRSFDELGLLIPGIAPPPQTVGDTAGPGVGPGVGSAGQFSANGLRSRGNNFTVDGSDNNDEDIGVRRQGFVALIPQPIDSIKEYQIISLLAPAQFGRNIGAQVNAVSRGGEKTLHGTFYGFFNSNRINSRNFFDTTNGDSVSPLTTASGQTVLLDGRSLTTRNQSGGEDTFTFGQVGATLGGALIKEKLFYFLSGEYQKINASQEKNFSVPTIEQRGPFRTGATGIFRNPFLASSDPNSAVIRVPNNLIGAGLFSLFPFPNNPGGIYGGNTFTQILPAGGQGVILSGKLDRNFASKNYPSTLTARYNFTNDEKDIPAVSEAIFSAVKSKTQTQNISIFYNSQLSRSEAKSKGANDSAPGGQMNNQVRFSFGRTHLKFDEIRDTEFLIPSDQFPNEPFLLNARLRLNTTRPAVAGTPNTGPVLFRSVLAFDQTPSLTTAEENFGGPLGQISIAGFSTLGTDVYNFPQNRVNNTFQLADELTWRLKEHSFVFGGDTRRTDLDSDLPRLARPLLTFNGVPRLIAPDNGGFRFPTAADQNPIIRPEDLVGFGAATNSLLTLNVDRPDSKVDLRYYQFNFYAQDTWRARSNLSVSYGLRYEYNSPVNEIDHLIEDTFNDARLALASGLNAFIDNRQNLYEPDRNNFAPRIGVAYSATPLGKNRISVFRAGYGIFYDQILGAVANQSRNVFPTFLTFNFAALSGTALTGLQYQNPIRTDYTTNQGVSLPLIRPGTFNTFNPAISLSEYIQYVNANFPSAINATLPARRLDMPMAHHYSFVYEQQLNSKLTVSVGYVGTQGRNLLRFTTPNLGSSLIITPTQTQEITYLTQGGGTLPVLFPIGVLRSPNRPDNRVGAINVFETTASSVYNSLQAQLRGRFTKRFDFQLAYTFAKVTDDVSDVFDLAGAYVLPQNSFNLKAEKGPANFDVRHLLTYNLAYFFPKAENNGFLAFLTDNLQIASLGRFHTGQPFTVNSIIDINLDGNLTDRLNTVQGIEITGSGRQPLRLLTDNTLSLLAPFGQDGQVRRNSFRAGKLLDLDLSVIKQFIFGAGRLNFRADIFNFINRANFGIPVRLLEAPGFGKATNTITPGRRIQFAVKYEF